MIAKMLDDLGAPGTPFKSWSVNHFSTNYLTDNTDSDDWEDIWMDTCDITVHTPEPVAVNVGPDELIDTWAYDESWQGEDSPILPIECVVVADFENRVSVKKAMSALDLVAKLKEDDSVAEELHSYIPGAPSSLIQDIREAYTEQKVNPHSLSVRQRAGLPHQILLSLGICDEAFFARGAKLAWRVSDLIHELGGTATWNELTS